MKKIYIVLTYTGSALSKAIRMYTRKEFSHVSISLDIDLKSLYSFGRRYSYSPFIAGFVHEDINNGTFKRFKNTQTRVYSLEVSNHQYKKIKKMLLKMENNKKTYKFNFIGLLAVAFNLKVKRENHFYCAEFVKYLLEETGTQIELPDLPKPMDFDKIDNSQEVYQGLLRNYYY